MLIVAQCSAIPLTGTCHCNLVSENGKFCRQWQCFQVEADEEVSSRCLLWHYTEDTAHCEEWEYYREKEAERTDCACDEPDHTTETNLPTSNFCSSWSCVEVDTKRWAEDENDPYQNLFGRRMNEDERMFVDERLEMVEGEKAELERYVSNSAFSFLFHLF